MKDIFLKYNVIIRKQGKSFIADVPTLGLSDFGNTIGEAKKHIKQAMVCHIEGLAKTKTEIPAPDNEDFYISQTEVSFPNLGPFRLAY